MDTDPKQGTEGTPDQPLQQAPQVQPSQPQSPEFKRVFSTTAKVILALFLISLGLGILWAIIVGIGESSSATRSSGVNFENEYLNSRTYYNEKADAAPTKMPLSQWQRFVASDIKGHCIREGMSTVEVEKAVGNPTSSKIVTYSGPSDTGAVWEYKKQRVVKKPCSKYEGEKCADPVEYETKTAVLYFSPSGKLTYPYLSGPLKTDLGDYSSCH